MNAPSRPPVPRPVPRISVADLGSFGSMPTLSVRCAAGTYVLGEAFRTTPSAVVHLGRLEGASAFTVPVAVACLIETDAALLERPRIASSVRHANVLAPTDIVAARDGLLVVYPLEIAVSLEVVLQSRARLDPNIASAIVSQVLRGLQAGHDLGVVHGHLAAASVEVGRDGIVRVLDLGLPAERLDSRGDVHAAGALLWRLVTGKPFEDGSAERLSKVIHGFGVAMDTLLARALDEDRAARWATPLEMAKALEAACPPAASATVADFVEKVAHAALAQRAELVGQLERRITASPSCPPRAPLSDRPTERGGGREVPGREWRRFDADESSLRRLVTARPPPPSSRASVAPTLPSPSAPPPPSSEDGRVQIVAWRREARRRRWVLRAVVLASVLGGIATAIAILETLG